MKMKMNYTLILLVALCGPGVAWHAQAGSAGHDDVCKAQVVAACKELKDAELDGDVSNVGNEQEQGKQSGDGGSIKKNCDAVGKLTARMGKDLSDLEPKCKKRAIQIMNLPKNRAKIDNPKQCIKDAYAEIEQLGLGASDFNGASGQDSKCSSDVSSSDKGDKKGGGGGGGAPPGGDQPQDQQQPQAATPVDCSTTPDGPGCGPICQNAAYLALNKDKSDECTGAGYKPPVATAPNLGGGNGLSSASDGSMGSSSGGPSTNSATQKEASRTADQGFKSGGDTSMHGVGGANKPGLPPNEDTTNIDKNVLGGKLGGGSAGSFGSADKKGTYDPITGSWIPPKLKNDTVNTNLFRPNMRNPANDPKVVGPDGILESSANMFLVHDAALQARLMPPKK